MYERARSAEGPTTTVNIIVGTGGLSTPFSTEYVAALA
jgi:hypothetical protein